MKDIPTETYVTKTDITGKKEVIGATLRVSTLRGRLVDETLHAQKKKIEKQIQNEEYAQLRDVLADYGIKTTEEGFHYREITFDDFNKLRNAGFDVASNCRQSTQHPDMVILRYTEQQTAQINAVLKPAVGAAIKK